jgi:flavin-dependent dehydrogenase
LGVKGVVVIGGGPAGASVAFHLARAGVPVTVVEAKAFPRAKVCGEYISPSATQVLEEIVPARELVAAGARRVDEFVIEVGELRVAWTTPQPAWALSRATLDLMLLEKAMAAGARVIQPAAVREVRYEGDRVGVRLSSGERLEADLVIHADGSGRHDPRGPVPMANGLVGYKCHVRAPAGAITGVTMRSCRGAYVGAIVVEGGLGTCALAASRELSAEFRENIDGMLASLLPAYQSSWRQSEWQACGIPRSGYFKPGHPRSLRIGNAAAAVDPVGGEGIGLALWSGCFAARLLSGEGAWTLESLTRCERELARAYRQRLRTRSWACRAGAGILMRPRLVRALWPLLQAPSWTLRPWYRLSGKPA